VTDVSRVLPAIEGPSAFFWTSGADGRLRLSRCEACGYLVHPPVPYCPACQGRATAPSVVSGHGVVYSYTVNHQAWDGTTEPYVIAVVELDDQPGVRLTTNIVGADPDEIRIGLPVEVVFQDHDPVYVPVFRPRRATAGEARR
jgi:uncharacterized OB-fold protein